MPRDLILGTAGHIDHGKTALVKALTGVDCDRLPEEKARGITIDIGFAQLDLGDYHLGIVDVPGHERFIRNMLAGATGIDLALLVVAADDGIMPQTREHLEILQLLGLRHGLIALTKCDLVDAASCDVSALAVRELVRGTFLEDAPLIVTSVHTGQGIDTLKSAIGEACRRVEAQAGREYFRMAIDRAFIVQGHGTVVTGSVTSGRVAVGDELEWLPRGERVRVRSLHHHDNTVDEVHRGQRAALNLAGVSLDSVHRGQELATPSYLVPSRVLTMRLRTLADAPAAIKHRAVVHLHMGTAETMATLSLLDCDRIEPGQWGLVQVFAEEPLMAVWGQPFVMRSASAQQTLGGGQVLQPVAKKLRRRHLDAIIHVERLWSRDPDTRAQTVAWFNGTLGITATDLVRSAGIALDDCPAVLERVTQRGDIVEFFAGTPNAKRLHTAVLAELDDRLLAVLQRLHAEAPLMTSHDRQKVQARLDYVGDEALVQAAMDRLIAQKRVVGDHRRVARADFKPKLSAALRKLKDKIVATFLDARLEPPEPNSFAGQAGGNAASLKDLFEVCVAEGHLVHLAGDLFLHADVEAELRRRVAEKLSDGSAMTVAEVRDLLGTTRKYAVPFCEYLDRMGVTRREGDLRRLATAHG
jgi:selenocysteine-specific elongation factor